MTETETKAEKTTREIIHEALFRRFCQLTKSYPHEWAQLNLGEREAAWQHRGHGRIFSVRF